MEHAYQASSTLFADIRLEENQFSLNLSGTDCIGVPKRNSAKNCAGNNFF